MMKIALVEDDPVMNQAVCALLTGEGHACKCFNTGNSLIQALRGERFDLFVLDWNLPDMSGLSVLAWIRNQLGPALPVLLLTSRASDADVVAGLAAGADDYVAKPFNRAILAARIAALARRTQGGPASDAPEACGRYAIDPARKAITRDGEDAALTAKEYQLASLLFRNRDTAVSRQHIQESIWGLRADIPTRTIDSHVARLRNKLALGPENGFQLVSVYGFGYRLESVSRTE